MAPDKPYDDIPGTTIFDSDMARKGYHVNQFCMSLMKAENRDVFRADEEAYLDDWPMTAEQRQGVLDRDERTLADGIGDPRLVGDRDRDLEAAVLETSQRAGLQHRVGELVQDPPRVGLAQVGGDAIHVPRSHRTDAQPEEAANPRGHLLTPRVAEGRTDADLDPGDHLDSLSKQLIPLPAT